MNHQKKKPFHKDWRVWIAAIVCLTGMALYIFGYDTAVVESDREVAAQP